MRLALGLAVLVLTSCAAPLAAPTAVPSPLPLVELKYAIFDQVGRPWYCDPDIYPLARVDEVELARQRLPDMQKDAETFTAILTHNGIAPGTAYSLGDQLLLALYHDWKDLQRLPLTPAAPDGTYTFSELVRPAGAAKQSDRVEGRVDAVGRVTIANRSPGGFLNCPICLAQTTLVDTPRGPVLVTSVRVGDMVWTQDSSGERVAAPILETGSMDAPAGHAVLRVTLADGRSVTASPGHPTADGRRIGSLAVGDDLDGSTVVRIDRLPYSGKTYDLLPAGPTGTYWADGVLLASTLARR